MTRQTYKSMMEKFVDLNNERIVEVVEVIGNKTSLNEGLDIAKALINNYFEENERAEEILKLIEKKKQEQKNDKQKT